MIPTLPEKDYTTGHIITYDKWTQKYGYFEARVKLPTARGLWPAFWMMPDRGPAAGPEGWKRENTRDGGMEMDILEHLTEWGPGRNNVAVHWDGYDKDHQALGHVEHLFWPDTRRLAQLRTALGTGQTDVVSLTASRKPNTKTSALARFRLTCY